jgi:hypothetical protein
MVELKTTGSKAEVYHGNAKHTSGGLTKKDLMKHKGRIVSRKKHAAGKKAIQRLFKAGYKPTKGTFKVMRKGSARSTRRRRGGFLFEDPSGNQTDASTTLKNVLDAAGGMPANAN